MPISFFDSQDLHHARREPQKNSNYILVALSKIMVRLRKKRVER
jgi:hypothetical protein